jgi:glycopeptide antibiotics resistance protein
MRLNSRLLLTGFLAILAVAIFPFGWLTQYSAAFDSFTGWLFPEPWGHFWGHFAIFFLVGAGGLLAFPALRTRPWLYGLLMLATAFAQEFFQLLYKQRPIVMNDVTDLIPDVLGVVVGWMVVRWVGRKGGASNDKRETSIK